MRRENIFPSRNFFFIIGGHKYFPKLSKRQHSRLKRASEHKTLAIRAPRGAANNKWRYNCHENELTSTLMKHFGSWLIDLTAAQLLICVCLAISPGHVSSALIAARLFPEAFCDRPAERIHFQHKFSYCVSSFRGNDRTEHVFAHISGFLYFEPYRLVCCHPCFCVRTQRKHIEKRSGNIFGVKSSVDGEVHWRDDIRSSCFREIRK